MLLVSWSEPVEEMPLSVPLPWFSLVLFFLDVKFEVLSNNNVAVSHFHFHIYMPLANKQCSADVNVP